MPMLTFVAVYCGSNSGADPAFELAAVSLGRTLAERGIQLIYGGGHVGLMGAIADAFVMLRGGSARSKTMRSPCPTTRWRVPMC